MATKRTTKKANKAPAAKSKSSKKPAAKSKSSKKPAAKSKPAASRTTKPGSNEATKPKTSSADTTATRCRSCDSTEREPYQQKREIPAAGQLAPDGKPATHIRLQWTKCKSCGQSRIDRTYLNRK